MKRSAKQARQRRDPHSALRTPRSDDLPFVLINMAMTADGKIASANRKISRFTSKRDHDNLLALRATADAVMCGARTADSAKINLGPGGKKYQRLRHQRGLAEYNLRIIVSGSGSIDPTSEVFKHQFSPIIILTTKRAMKRVAPPLLHLAEVIGCGDTWIDFTTFLHWLRKVRKVKRLLCEGGGELNDALFRAGLVDEIHLTISPKLFGGRNAPTIADGFGFPSLPEAAQFQLKSARRVGDEMFLTYGAISHR
jgi:riboflavin-specific deaminase-like protein